MSLTNLVDREENSGGAPSPPQQLKSGKSTPGTYTLSDLKPKPERSQTVENILKEIDELKAATAQFREEVKHSKSNREYERAKIPEKIRSKKHQTVPEEPHEGNDDFFDKYVNEIPERKSSKSRRKSPTKAKLKDSEGREDAFDNKRVDEERKSSSKSRKRSPQKTLKQNKENDDFFDKDVHENVERKSRSPPKGEDSKTDDFFDKIHVSDEPEEPRQAQEPLEDDFFDKLVDEQAKEKVDPNGTAKRQKNGDESKNDDFFDQMVEQDITENQTNGENFFEDLVSSKEKRPSSLRNLKRQNSFAKTRQFFESQGTIIEEKDYHKEKTNDMTEEEKKMALWMPKGMSTPSAKNSRSSSLASGSQESKG